MRPIYPYCFSLLVCTLVVFGQPQNDTAVVRSAGEQQQFEAFPILSYDSDAGFGYGAKIFFLNVLNTRESFDIIFFQSTKGERWYRTAFSFPDINLRQRTPFPFALDIVLDYDTWINNNFFGIGNGARSQDREQYTKEPFDVSISIGRAFSTATALHAGVRYTHVQSRNIEPQGRLVQQLRHTDAQRVGIFILHKYDTRDSFINPKYGVLMQQEIGWYPARMGSTESFSQLQFLAQLYYSMLGDAVTAAFRMMMEQVIGSDVPVQFLPALGGNQSLRGYPQERFLDRSRIVLNSEFRVLLYGRWDGVVGLDAGNVWRSIQDVQLEGWKSNVVAGIRLRMNTFIVRLDVGESKEGTGMYLNFGQLF